MNLDQDLYLVLDLYSDHDLDKELDLFLDLGLGQDLDNDIAMYWDKVNSLMVILINKLLVINGSISNIMYFHAF